MHDKGYACFLRALEHALKELSLLQRRIVDEEVLADRYGEGVAGTINFGGRGGGERDDVCGVRGQVPDLKVAAVGRNSDNDGGEDDAGGICSVRCSFWR